MRNFLITLIFIFTSSFMLKADWYKLDLNGEVIPFSKIANDGKISVFIVSIPSCAPCKVLKKDLQNDNTIDLKKVDFYDVNLTTDITERDRRAMKTFEIWQEAEKLREFPYIYVLSPTTNITSRGLFKSYEIKEIIDRLVILFNDYEPNSMLASKSDVTPFKNFGNKYVNKLRSRNSSEELSNVTQKNVDNEEKNCENNEYLYKNVNIKIGDHPHDNKPYVRIVFYDVESNDVSYNRYGKKRISFVLKNRTFNEENLHEQFIKIVGNDIKFEKMISNEIILNCKNCKITNFVKNVENERNEKWFFIDVFYTPFY